MERIKVSAVSYLNTKPFLYGIEHHPVKERIELSLDTPAEVASKLIGKEAQIGLVPVAVLPLIPSHTIIGDYCIGCVGAVYSVCIYSQVPIQEVKSVLLDYQSRTSVELAKILLKEFWKVSPQFIPAYPGFEEKIDGATAGVIIGDRSFLLKEKFPYCYDMGEAWQSLTGLPFAFAVWASNCELPAEFISSFNEALRYGIEHIGEVAAKFNNTYPTDVRDYLSDKISYPLDDSKRKALNLFLEKIKS